MRSVAALLAVIVLIAAVAYWQLSGEEYQWKVSANTPLPVVPDDNPMSDVKVALGRLLFYDTRLSVNGTTSCASCHIQAQAFTDARAKSVGATGVFHPRSSMSLVNVAYASRLTWANHLLDRLEDQALTPMFGDHPIEMGMAGKEQQIVDLLRSDSEYATLTKKAFPNDADPYSIIAVVRSIAAFVRTIISFDSPYDQYMSGDEQALSAAAESGMALFFSERLECFHCHGGFNFTDSSTHANAVTESIGYHNTGLYNLDGNGGYPADNTGLYDMTGVRRDMGRFKAPSLRNIALTAPYMHDGSLLTLEEVLAHYARGGRLIAEGAYAGDGRLSPFKSEFVQGFELSSGERNDLISFLQALTDSSVISDGSLSDPRVNRTE